MTDVGSMTKVKWKISDIAALELSLDDVEYAVVVVYVIDTSLLVHLGRYDYYSETLNFEGYTFQVCVIKWARNIAPEAFELTWKLKLLSHCL